MRKYLYTIFFVLSLLGNTAVAAQDPMYSQFFHSPLSLNPAFTGYYDGIHRLSANFRNQWLGFGDPFTTASASFDTRLAVQRTGNNILGMGVMMLGDRTGAGAYNSNYLSFSGAYHQALDEEGYHHLGIGFQGNWGSRAIDYNRISFSNQLTSRGFDISLPNNENFPTQKTNYSDLNAGIMYNYLKDRNRAFLGFSAYHINQPVMSFLGADSYRLPARYTVHGGASFLVGYQSELYVSGQFMKQGAVSNASVGMVYGHSMQDRNDENVFYAGVFYRHKDAVYPYVGYLFNDIRIGMSYDVNISGLTLGSRRSKSFELSVIYYFFDQNIVRQAIPWH